ncbi:hypothetical protein SFRURICE_006269 [Spodoptera frugiperda]|nr:hypothetical protein SFRURICE_006269 [Spodoptera frugiperda]
MGRTKKLERKIGGHSAQDMQKAIQLVKDGFVPNYEVNAVFTHEQVTILKNYISECALMFYGLTAKDTRQLAYQVATANNLKVPPSWVKNNSAYLKAMMPINITNAFKKCGIFPHDNSVFTEEDFLPSSVTDRPEPDKENNSTTDIEDEINEPISPSILLSIPSQEIEEAIEVRVSSVIMLIIIHNRKRMQTLKKCYPNKFQKKSWDPKPQLLKM